MGGLSGSPTTDKQSWEKEDGEEMGGPTITVTRASAAASP